jgi:hypothetical protein
MHNSTSERKNFSDPFGFYKFLAIAIATHYHQSAKRAQKNFFAGFFSFFLLIQTIVR